MVCLAWNVVWERPLPTKVCDWEMADVMDHVCRDALLNSQRFGALRVESQAMCLTVDGKSRTRDYGAWKMRMSELHKAAVHRACTAIDMR